jgi:hypothetical protein
VVIGASRGAVKRIDKGTATLLDASVSINPPARNKLAIDYFGPLDTSDG